MLIRTSRNNRSPGVKNSEITPESVYFNRRQLLRAAGISSAASLLPGLSSADDIPSRYKRIPDIRKSAFSTDADLTSFEDVTSYNNFYEFGTDKSDPSENSGAFHPLPCSLRVEGEAELTGTYTLEDILAPHAQEERLYRMRCVEAWSMVVPWVGIPLGDIISRFKPTSKAKYVAFETIVRPAQMPGQKRAILPWPYREGLRMDEAMNPLTILATGLYGVDLPNQNGAPLRLVVPWKYGFKSIKSIVGISFTEEEPYTTWNDLATNEYGFYANVNPEVDHPRWSQARHRNIGEGLFSAKHETLMFNGYADEVADLYRGMDLKRFF